jgi:hypothetical protein
LIGRTLLLFTAVSLATMPLTQHLWTWDHFLHGGRDFELGILMVLSLLSLTLVLAKSSKQCIEAFFSACCGFENTFPNSAAPQAQLLAAGSPARSRFATCPPCKFCNLPLQI